MEFLGFVFSSFWVWLGFFLMLVVFNSGLESICSFLNSKTIVFNRKEKTKFRYVKSKVKINDVVYDNFPWLEQYCKNDDGSYEWKKVEFKNDNNE